jgi:hypothetical protein
VVDMSRMSLGIGYFVGALGFLVVNGWLDYEKRRQGDVLAPATQPPQAPPPSPQLARVLSIVQHRAQKQGATVTEIAVAAGLSDADAVAVETGLAHEVG